MAADGEKQMAVDRVCPPGHGGRSKTSGSFTGFLPPIGPEALTARSAHIEPRIHWRTDGGHGKLPVGGH